MKPAMVMQDKPKRYLIFLNSFLGGAFPFFEISPIFMRISPSELMKAPRAKKKIAITTDFAI
jgi:hypothetical protein